MLFNYIVGNLLSNNSERKKRSPKQKQVTFTRTSILTFGVVSNLTLLGYFKYSDFFIANLNNGLALNIEPLNLALPLAISFFTFQQIAYLVDSYRLETQEYDFLNYAVFVTFFPQLIAGPIVHHKEMMPQFANIRTKVINYKNIALGLFIFSIGLFKKVIIADTFSVWSTNGFDLATSLTLLQAWGTSLSYTFQLYFDFSGYTDMAIGLALLFNIKLPINFNSPYKATNIQEFWRRWHITLSRFLRDYIYFPLGGSRKGRYRTYENLMATFVLGGLWHGAGWTFIFWGLLHGTALVIHRLWNQLGLRLWAWLGWFITFNFINISWVFFRAKEWTDAIKVISAMFSLNAITLSLKLRDKLTLLTYYGIEINTQWDNIWGDDQILKWMIIGFVLVLGFKNTTQMMNTFKPTTLTAIVTGIILFYISISINVKSEFLYFNF